MRLLAPLLLIAHASAFAADERFMCGSTPATHEQAAHLSRWVEQRQAPDALLQKRDVISTRTVNNFLVVSADQTTAPFDDPADLEGMSLHFKRKNPIRFVVSREPLAYDTAIG